MADPRKNRHGKKKRKHRAKNTIKLEKRIEEKVENHEETRKRCTKEAVDLGCDLNELEELKGLSKHKWTAFVKKRYSITGVTRRRYMKLGRWINLKTTPHLEEVSQQTLYLLIDICEKAHLRPSRLPHFLKKYNIAPKYKVGDREAARKYNERLRNKLNLIKADLKGTTIPVANSPQPTQRKKSNPNIYSSFDEIDNLPSPPANLSEGIYLLEESFINAKNTEASQIDSVFLPQLYELSLDIKKLLKTYNQKHPRQKFDLSK